MISEEATALVTLRAVMTRIHENGNIYYNPDRMEAYCMLAKIASDMRKDLIRRYA